MLLSSFASPTRVSGGLSREESALGFPRRRPYHGLTRGKSSLRLRLPYRVSPVHHREPVVTGQGRDGPLLPRFLPLQRLSATRSYVSPPGPIPLVALRPQGFAPSRRFAPLMAFRAYSIPVPLMGFCPSRLFSSFGAVRPHRRRCPRGFSPALASRGRPFRDSRTKRSTSAGPGISRVAAVNASMGFSASRCLVVGSEGRSSRPCIPSHAFSTRSQAGLVVGASGYSLPRTQPVSLETGEPPCSFPPLCLSVPKR